jgi:hypothetical protein
MGRGERASQLTQACTRRGPLDVLCTWCAMDSRHLHMVFGYLMVSCLSAWARGPRLQLWFLGAKEIQATAWC